MATVGLEEIETLSRSKKYKKKKQQQGENGKKIPSFIWAFYLEWTRNYRRQPCSQSTNKKGVAFVSIFRKLQFFLATTSALETEIETEHYDSIMLEKFPKW